MPQLDPKLRLLELVEKAASKNNCSSAQTEMIVALVKSSIENGVPEISDLEGILRGIGGN